MTELSDTAEVGDWPIFLWGEVLARPGAWGPFVTPEWQRAWLRWALPDVELEVHALHCGDRVVGIAPLGRERDGPYQFGGGVALTDYPSPAFSPSDVGAVADAVVGLIGSLGARTVLDARNLLDDSFVGALCRAARGAGLAVSVLEDETAMTMDLPGSREEYLRRLGGKRRHELRRKRSRLRSRLPGFQVRRSDDLRLDRDLDAFLSLFRGAVSSKAEFMTDRTELFFREIAGAFMRRGWLCLDLLEADGLVLAGTVGFRRDGRYWLYNSAYDRSAGELAPGLMLLWSVIETAIDEGLQVFDFMRGTEPYKKALGAHGVRLQRVRIGGRGQGGTGVIGP